MRDMSKRASKYYACLQQMARLEMLEFVDAGSGGARLTREQLADADEPLLESDAAEMSVRLLPDE